MAPSSNSIPTQRLPAPSLFIGPPSRNASNLDLSTIKSPTGSQLSPTKSSLSRSNTNTVRIAPSALIPSPGSPLPEESDLTAQEKAAGLAPPSPSPLHNLTPGARFGPPPPPDPHDEQNKRLNAGDKDAKIETQSRGRRGTAVLDAHWAALQSTLSDIEISASGTAHVFGPNHADALEDLRDAQVALARAWGPRGDETGDGFGGTGLGSGLMYGSVRGKTSFADEGKKGAGLERTETKTTATGSTKTTTTGTSGKTKGGSEQGSGSGNDSGSKQGSAQERKKGLAGPSAVGGKEADADLDAAEQRRKESDAYFKRVKEGVEEVVRKLEGVSKAMRNVELESREIWGDAESEGSTELLDSTSLMTGTMSPI